MEVEASSQDPLNYLTAHLPRQLLRIRIILFTRCGGYAVMRSRRDVHVGKKGFREIFKEVCAVLGVTFAYLSADHP
jgi:hypothetical protein